MFKNIIVARITKRWHINLQLRKTLLHATELIP